MKIFHGFKIEILNPSKERYLSLGFDFCYLDNCPNLDEVISNAGHAFLCIERQCGLMIGDALVALLVVGAGGGKHVAAGGDVERVTVVDCSCWRVGHFDGGAWIIISYIETKCEFSCIQFVSVKPYRQRMVCIHVDAAGEGSIKCRAA